MKKHIFGFALFGFIFTIFAVAFAYFYAPPLPQIFAVDEKIYVKEITAIDNKPTYCKKQENKLSAEVINSQYFVGKNKLISEVKLVWNGTGEPPKKVSVTTMFSDLDKSYGHSFGDVQIIENPFESASEKVLTFVSRGEENMNIAKDENFYVVTGVSVYPSDGQYKKQNLSEKKAVVVNW